VSRVKILIVGSDEAVKIKKISKKIIDILSPIAKYVRRYDTPSGQRQRDYFSTSVCLSVLLISVCGCCRQGGGKLLLVEGAIPPLILLIYQT